MATDSLVIAQANVPEQRSTVAAAGHTILLLVIIAAWSTWGYFGAARMRGTSNPHRAATYAVTILWEWAVVGYIAWGVRRRGCSMGALIGGAWKSVSTFFLDIALATGFWLTALVVLFCAALALHVPRSGDAIRFILPQTRLEIVLWVMTSLTAGICEETIFRGYFQKQFIAWTGNVSAGVLLSAVAFGAGHIYQGARSAAVIAIYG